MSLWIFLSICLVTGAGGFWFLLSRLNTGHDGQENIAEWFEEFSLDAYRPMQRLLDQNDYSFLETQPGYRPSIAKELRAERKQVFQVYLRQLIRDFNKLVHLSNLLLIHSEEDQPELAKAIHQIRMRFFFNVTVTQLSLALPVVRWNTTRATSLIGLLSEMRDSIHTTRAVAAS